MRLQSFLRTALALFAIACTSDPIAPSPPSTARDQGAEHTKPASPAVAGLLWPIACIPGQTCDAIGYPDVDGDNKAFNCSTPFVQRHEGTDIAITREQMHAGIDVFAAADGEVLWVFDGKFDDCPNANEPDCREPAKVPEPGVSEGFVVCTELGPYCPEGGNGCYWCFAGGNVVVVRHHDTPGVFATRYDHLRKHSIVVKPGDKVRAGQKIALAGSAGHSSQPHLHFEVWGSTFYQPTEPFAGPCGPNKDKSLWAHDPPWAHAR